MQNKRGTLFEQIYSNDVIIKANSQHFKYAL